MFRSPLPALCRRVRDARTADTSARQGDDGFTLIEAVVSVAIFAVVAAGGTAALISSTDQGRVTRDEVNGTTIAQQQISDAIDQQRVDQQNGLSAPAQLLDLNAPVQPADAGSLTYTVTRTATYLHSGTACSDPQTVPVAAADGSRPPRGLVITVTVTPEHGNTRSTQLSTVIAC